MPGGVGGQRREPLPTRLEITFPHETTKGAEHRNIIILSFSADTNYPTVGQIDYTRFDGMPAQAVVVVCAWV